MNEYQVIDSASLEGIQLSVRIEMLSVWEPLGGVAVVSVGDGDFVYFQAMMREIQPTASALALPE